MSRRQTTAQKYAADVALVRNSIEAMERFLDKYPTDRFNADRRRQLAMLKSKYADMTASQRAA